jgi:hypothetical protein
MAELADAADSKSAEGNLVGVRPPLPAPNPKRVILKMANLSERPFSLVAIGFDVRDRYSRTGL